METDFPTPTRRIVMGLMLSALIFISAVVAYVLSGWSWFDSLYMVVITVSGVGYGEVHPISTPALRWITIALIVLGYIAVIYTVGGIARWIVDAEVRRTIGIRKMQKKIEQLEKHVVICGYGRMGSKLAEALSSRGKPLLIIDQELARVEQARSRGFLAIVGNATEEEVLVSAGVARASVLTTVLSDDVANVFITITAHELNPQLEILARAEQASTIKKLRQVGASRVILPASIGADRLAQMILRPSAETLLQLAELPEGLNDDLSALGLRLDELEIQDGSPLIDGSIADLKIRGKRPFLIVALRTVQGEVRLNPASSERLHQGDCVVILANIADLPQLCSRYALQSDLPNSDPVKDGIRSDAEE